MKIGDVKKDGFHEWNVPPEKAIERVEREWMALKGGPWTSVLDLLHRTRGSGGEEIY